MTDPITINPNLTAVKIDADGVLEAAVMTCVGALARRWLGDAKLTR